MPVIDVVPSPAAQADLAVLALSAVSRGQAVPPDQIGQGLVLCNYLAALLQEDPMEETAWEFPSGRAKRMDRESLLSSGVTLDQVARVRQQLVGVQQGQVGKDIEAIQRFLVKTTMPMWHRRARECREARRGRWLRM